MNKIGIVNSIVTGAMVITTIICITVLAKDL